MQWPFAFVRVPCAGSSDNRCLTAVYIVLWLFNPSSGLQLCESSLILSTSIFAASVVSAEGDYAVQLAAVRLPRGSPGGREDPSNVHVIRQL